MSYMLWIDSAGLLIRTCYIRRIKILDCSSNFEPTLFLTWDTSVPAFYHNSNERRQEWRTHHYRLICCISASSAALGKLTKIKAKKKNIYIMINISCFEGKSLFVPGFFFKHVLYLQFRVGLMMHGQINIACIDNIFSRKICNGKTTRPTGEVVMKI